jgi:hypothetical protein
VSLPFAETVFFFFIGVHFSAEDVIRGPSPISANKGGLASSSRELSNVAMLSDRGMSCQHSGSYNEVASTSGASLKELSGGVTPTWFLGYISRPSQGNLKSLVLCDDASQSLEATSSIPQLTNRQNQGY